MLYKTSTTSLFIKSACMCCRYKLHPVFKSSQRNCVCVCGGANIIIFIKPFIGGSEFFTNLVIHITFIISSICFVTIVALYSLRFPISYTFHWNIFFLIYYYSFLIYYSVDINSDIKSLIMAHAFTVRKAYFWMIAWKEVAINLRWCRVHAYRQLRHTWLPIYDKL